MSGTGNREPGTEKLSAGIETAVEHRTVEADELPIHLGRPEREARHAVAHDALLRVTRVTDEVVEVGAAGTNGELPDAVRGIFRAVPPLPGEAFVEMIVTIAYHFRARGFEQRPHVAHAPGRIAGAGREQRMMPDRHRAGRALCLERGAHELVLRRSGGRRDVRIEHENQPVTG